jgi:hypothetical protein
MTGEGTRDKGLADNDPALESTDLLLKGSIGSPPTFSLSIETDDFVAIRPARLPSEVRNSLLL